VANDVSDAEHVASPGDAAEPGARPAGEAPAPLGEPPLSDQGLAGLAPPGAVTWAGDVVPSADELARLAAATAPPKPPRRARRRYPNATRRPIVGLTALILTALVAAFFGWASAEPFWLAMGRGAEGTVTVTSCRQSGLDERCVGDFVASGKRFTADAVRLSGVPNGDRKEGASFRARMLDSDSSWAYAGPASALHLRWELGVLVVVLCGILVGLVTGVRRLRTAGRGGRFLLWLLGLAGPLAIFAGMLVTAAL
jgi:hypothetical protein